ncbi:MAG TPA: M24 family metallopeptidase [Acidimicrobiales bacterium]|nr:M24 family metallopeptidase [Acidimicrobiales bacterium]
MSTETGATAVLVTPPSGGTGTEPLPEGGRVDFVRLREERRRRVFAAMEQRDVDVLVLGRPGNIAYAAGVRQLWTAGSRPFGPACIAVRETGRIHLLSTWDEGVPDAVHREDLFGLSWNPAIIASNVTAIPGLAGARLVAADGYSPGAGDLVAAATPGATLVDANPLLNAARVPRTPDEIACVQIASALAERAMTSMLETLRPGVTERQMLGVYLETIAQAGCQIPPSESVVCALPRRGLPRLRRVAGDRAVGPGELVALNPGAFYGGYMATLARTWPSDPASVSRGQEELGQRARSALHAVVSACRPGATGSDLVSAWDATGEPPPPEPLAMGVGLGVEGPLIGHRCGRDSVLSDGQILAVQSWVAAEGVGGVLEQEMILVGNTPGVITRYARSARQTVAPSDL